FPRVSIEDPFDQDDWEDQKRFLTQVDIQVVGDDLTVTNMKCIAQVAELWACNCFLLEVNQIGSVTESSQARLAQSHGWGVMVSHHLGKTEDTFIADLVVGLCTGQVSARIPCHPPCSPMTPSNCPLSPQIKTGAPCLSERLGKYNQLMK
ncbi:ENOB enolase, partial [Callaeas wilsoni]|nr:ENOB enolase [Callaeas wilsoni]